MIPSFREMVIELNDLSNVLIYESAQENEWGVIMDNMFQFKVNAKKPSDEFLIFYINTMREPDKT